MRKVFLFIAVIFTSMVLAKAQEFLRPPTMLKAIYELEKPNVKLDWWAPGTPLWMHYDNGEFAGGVGLNEAGEFDIAIGYAPNDLIPFVGMGVTKFSFAPAEENATYIFTIWTGAEADSIIYKDTIIDPVINKWNTVALDSAIILESDRIYYFGYKVIAEGGYPAGLDTGPASEPGKCGMIRTEPGPFYSLYGYNIDNNLCMQVYLEEQNTEVSPKFSRVSEIKLGDTPVNEFKYKMFDRVVEKEKEVVRSVPDSYKVYRNEVFIASASTNTYEEVLAEGGVYQYSVSAVYGDKESEKSKSVQVIFDNQRVPVNYVLGELFINVGTYEGENGDQLMNSPASPGAFMGFFELKFAQEKFVPIVYHSAQNMMGYDPFGNQDSENRLNYYLVKTLAFPLAMFNGNGFLGGGSGDKSLYEDYLPIYTDKLDAKTPLNLSCSLEKTSNSSYNLKVDIDMVGFYPRLKYLKLYTILTQNELSFSWANEKFDKVRYVATKMYPDAFGTQIEIQNQGQLSQEMNIAIDPFKPIANYRLAVFVQDTLTDEILNVDYLVFPYKKNVTFKVTGKDGLPLENASITVGEETKTTDADGSQYFLVWSNIGEVAYEITAPDYNSVKAMFRADTATQINVQLIPTGIENELESRVQFYPNPVNNTLIVEGANGSSMIIFDAAGKLIYQSNLSGVSSIIDVSFLQKGIYTARIMKDDATILKRFVKN